ncbi:hypothetical protein H8959_005401 [Pygathrix nigripes]
MAAAAQLSLTQLSSGNPVYEKYYRQVDTGNTGRVFSSDAAAFLKKSGLPDLILGKIWDLADTDGKGILNKQEFFVALRLVACAQNGLEVSLSSLNLAVPPPRFHDTSSPLLISGTSAAELPWAVKHEDKVKYDAIFDSLSPVNGFLSGDKVKPVLLNSKLPVDILGRVWELSDIDHDGMLDRDEFAVAMFLVYCALEKEPVPMSLPPALVPPSKRKTWVVSPAEKAKYDEIFLKTDKDMDGFVSGLEVREIFLKTGLPSTLLAHIWSLCDTKDCGKLSKDQFALAFHLISQKLIKGIDPPHVLTPEMIPPSDRASLRKRRKRRLKKDEMTYLTGAGLGKKKNLMTPYNWKSKGDPFKDDPFGKIDPFGGDPFKGSDPFASDCFFRQSTDPFATSSTDPFSAANNSNITSVETLKHNDPFAPGGTVVAASDSGWKLTPNMSSKSEEYKKERTCNGSPVVVQGNYGMCQGGKVPHHHLVVGLQIKGLDRLLQADVWQQIEDFLQLMIWWLIGSLPVAVFSR